MKRAPMAMVAAAAVLTVGGVLTLLPASAGVPCDACEEELLDARQAWSSFLIAEREDWAETFDAARAEQRALERCYENHCPGVPTYVPVDAEALAERCDRLETLRSETALRLRAWRAGYDAGELDVEPAVFHQRAEALEEEIARWRLRILACNRMVRSVWGEPAGGESAGTPDSSEPPRLLQGTTYGLSPQDIDSLGLPMTGEIVLPNEPERALPPVPDPRADIAIAKDTDFATAPAGSQITHKITIRNLGPLDATNVVVRDTLPPGARYLDFDSSLRGVQVRSNRSDGTVDFRVLELPVDDVVEIEVLVQIPLEFRGAFTNRVELIGGDPLDPNPGNDQGQATTDVSAPAMPMCQPFGIYSGAYSGDRGLNFGEVNVLCDGSRFQVVSGDRIVSCDGNGLCGHDNLFNGEPHDAEARRVSAGEFVLTFFRLNSDGTRTGISRSERFRHQNGGSR